MAQPVEQQIGLLDCQCGVPSEPPRGVVVMLHGYAMDAEDLYPVAMAIKAPVALYVPRGPLCLAKGRAWWPVDTVRRSWQLSLGPRDLHLESPEGRVSARRLLGGLLDAVRHRHPELPVLLAGFSQGGMLACDTLLIEDHRVEALALLSTSRIAWDEWQPRLHRLQNLPVLVAHGRSDADLSLEAGQRLYDAIAGGGARAAWLEFEGGHEIPLTVWRQLARMVVQLTIQGTHP